MSSLTSMMTAIRLMSVTFAIPIPPCRARTDVLLLTLQTQQSPTMRWVRKVDVSPVTRLMTLILPALTIALPAAAVYQRLLRTDLITTLQDDFILMARSKGMSKRRVLFGHALRPSMFSFITVFGINTGGLIGGALVIERVFRIPGLGTAIVEAILREDFPVVLAIVILISAAFVVINLLVDILYSIIDPRVRR